MSLTVVELQKKYQGVNEYLNVPLASVNDHVIRMSVMTEPYPWHRHPDSDETFLVVEGIMVIETENQSFELSPGQLLTIPANERHCTRPKEARSVNLTFESAGISTVMG